MRVGRAAILAAESPMSMIFPGMDPYLENRSLWPGIHNSLVVYIRDQLQPFLRPRYLATLEFASTFKAFQAATLPDLILRLRAKTRTTAVLEANAPVTFASTIWKSGSLIHYRPGIS